MDLKKLHIWTIFTQCELFENIFHGFFTKIISETLQKPIKTFLQLFKEKCIIFNNVSLQRQCKFVSTKNSFNCVQTQ